MAVVNINRCKEYDKEQIKSIIENGFEKINFDPEILKGKYIALKPNLLMAAKPEKAITTHPVFFEAVVEIVKKYSDNIIIIESPAMTSLNFTMKKNGYSDIIEKHNLKLADLSRVTTVHNSKAKKFKSNEVISDLLDVDFLINLPKLKSHKLTYFTGALKNLFGLMPGMKKSKMHFKAPSAVEFSDFLLDFYGGIVNLFKGKVIHLMDGIVGMEGNGPGTSGKARDVGVVLMSDDAIALDYAASQIVSFDYKNILYIKDGFDSPYGVDSIDDIEFKGDDITELKINDFIKPDVKLLDGVAWDWVVKFLKPLITDKPVPKEDRCTLCYHCKKICPADAISFADGNKKIPVYDYAKCIRCYCCTETCPEAAIDIKKGKLQWILR